MEQKERILWIDNLRAFLIVCVVFGHLIRTIPVPGRAFLYTFIYSFHMPTMIFLSGLCAKEKVNVKGILKRILLPYVIFQILFFLVDFFLAKEDVTFSLLTPDWILWYLVSLAIWSLVIPLFKTEKKWKRTFFLSLSILVSLLVGYINQIGLFLSLSRTIVFFPFFLSGFYMKGKEGERERGEKREKKKVMIPVFVLALFSLLIITLFCNNIPLAWLYHWKSYMLSSYNIIIRATMLGISAVFVYLAYVLTTNKKIPYISYLGQNTIMVYLLHGPVIRIFRAYQESFNFVEPIFLAIGLTIATTLLFANPLTAKAWSLVFGKRRKWEK